MLNSNSRKKNALLISSLGIAEQCVAYLSGFAFRTVFLYILGASYLGISTLFSSVLQAFSLVELGVGGVIVYHMYDPIKRNDTTALAALLNFYKLVYRLMALATFVLGLLVFPFLHFIIADPGNIPADVDLNLIYWLFVMESVTSYLFSYIQSLQTADQRGYVLSFGSTIRHVVLNVFKIILLVITANYTLVLASGIAINILYNLCISRYTHHKYRSIVNLSKSERLTREERFRVYKDTGAVLCHRIGCVAITSSDSIILSSFVGISTLGLYSNYALLSTAVDVILNKLFGGFVPTLGNVILDDDAKKTFSLYRYLRFGNTWIASFCAICFFALIEPFITLWLGADYLLGYEVAAALGFNLFINTSRIINSSFISASGLFVRDKARPLIQGIMNIVISIVLVIHLGVVGVLFGTIVSTILTTAWREGYILYKDLFNEKFRNYIFFYCGWATLTILIGTIAYILCSLTPGGLLGFFVKMAVCLVLVNGLYFLLFHKTESFRFFKDLIATKTSKLFTNTAS